MKRLSLLLLPLFLSGCSLWNPFIKIVEVEKIVPVPCPPPVEVARPTLPINTLSSKDKNNYKLIGKAYVESLIILQSYSIELEQALEPYKKGNTNGN